MTEFSFAMNGYDEDLSHIDFGTPVASRIQGNSLKSLVNL